MRQSKVAKLPREVREEIERRWREKAFGLDDLLAWVREQDGGAAISRSGLGRYVANAEDTFRRIREAQEVAARCVEKLGENPRGDVGRLLVQMLGAMAVQTLDQMGEKPESADTKELFFLSSAIRNLASAEKTGVDRELKIREKLRAELEKKVDEAKKDAPKDQASTFEKARELVRGLL